MAFQANERVVFRASRIPGIVRERRRAIAVHEPTEADPDHHTMYDVGAPIVVDQSGQMAVEVTSEGRAYWVFAREHELERS
jgi:hypothetical protein